MSKRSLAQAAVGIVVCLLAAAAFCSNLLMDFGGWGHHDWDYFFWNHLAAYRSLLEFREWPLWNPWSVGGLPMLGNPQSQVASPWFLLDLAVGPVRAFKLSIVSHYAICLGGMYWMGRELGLSRLAAVYAAGTFTFSTWLALRVFSGHYTFVSFAYLPWVIGLLHRARRSSWNESWKILIPGGLLLGLMILHGTWEIVFTGVTTGLLALLWGVQSRSPRYLIALTAMVTLGCGISAVKLLPTLDLMRVHDREIKAKTMMGIDRLKTAPTEEERIDLNAPGQSPAKRIVHGAWAEGTRLEPLGILFKAFFGREQRGVTYYFIRSSAWHEYGAYLGLIGALLGVAALFLRRDAWPWMILGGTCFLLGLGSFSRFAPYHYLHQLPVFRSMHSAPRFFIPMLLAASTLGAMALDELGARLHRRAQDGHARLTWIIPVLVVLALSDSIIVARYSLHGTFRHNPPTVPERLAELRTVNGNAWYTTPLMLSNRAIRNGYEPLGIPAHVHAEGEPDYRGEHYFLAEGSGKAGATRLEAWSPNSAKVAVETDEPGLVVLNRNWDKGWRAGPSFEVVNHEGLVAVRVPAGNHLVEFSYHSPPAAIGAIVSLLSIAACLLAPVFGRSRGTAPAPAAAEPEVSVAS